MRKFVKYIIAFFIPLLLGMFSLFLFPLNKNFSYHFVKGECDNKASWIYNRIFVQKDNIDIAFMGASHISCAIMDEYIEIALNTNSEQEIKLANLGYCRAGRDIQYVMLKDLFQHKKPKLLVLEVMEDEPKKSHPVFPYLAESSDLWGSFVFFNQRYFTNIWKGIVVRFEQLKSNIFKEENPGNENPSAFSYIPSTQLVATADILENKMNWERRISKSKPELIRNSELNYSKQYLEKTVKLAQQNNCEVLFLYLHESGSNIKEPFLAEYYKSFGKLITLPDSIVSNPSNWKDATHFNDSGALKTSKFMVEEISDFLN